MCEKDYKNLKVHQRMAHKDTPVASTTKDEKVVENTAPAEGREVNMADVLGVVKGIANKMDSIETRLDKVETGGANDFKKEVVASDIASAATGKEGIDPKIVQMVEELLGEDFKIEVEGFSDRPGLLFTVIVPPRLSDVQPSQRPILDSETGEYRMTKGGETELETYQPEDRRSRAISSIQSYDAIRQHCERVRSYIVTYYQKASKPIPEFKIKSTV